MLESGRAWEQRDAEGFAAARTASVKSGATQRDCVVAFPKGLALGPFFACLGRLRVPGSASMPGLGSKEEDRQVGLLVIR